jgi:thiol-disulfide isomerase/thioredoxin
MKNHNTNNGKIINTAVLALALVCALIFAACGANKSSDKNAASNDAPANETSDSGTDSEDTTSGSINMGEPITYEELTGITSGAATTGDSISYEELTESTKLKSAEVESLINAKTKDLDGKKFDMSTQKGKKLTVVNVWATWCSPCVEELPAIAKISKEYESKGVRVIGILLDAVQGNGAIDNNAIKEAKTLIANAKATYPSIIPEKTLINSVLKKTDAIPATFIIKSNGEVVDTILGGLDYDGWKKAIEKALK